MSREERELPAGVADRQLTADEIQELIEIIRLQIDADARLAQALDGIASPAHVRVAETPDGAASLQIRGVLPWTQAIQLLRMLEPA